MKKLSLTFLLAVLAGSLLAKPAITNLALNQDAKTHLVTITYDLSEDAVVTPRILVNGAALPYAETEAMAGDVHRLVTAGTKTIYWKPAGAVMDALVAEDQASVELSAWAKDDPPDYMVLDTTVTGHVRFYVSEEALPGGIGDRRYKTQKVLMRKIYAKGVRWPMGSETTYDYYSTCVQKPHFVTLTTNYYINVFEITQRQFTSVVGDRHVAFGFADRPDSAIRPANMHSFATMRHTYYYDESEDTATDSTAVWPTAGHKVAKGSYVDLFRRRFGVGFEELDLPTEAQWEYACRAGEAGQLYTGETMSDEALGKIAWFSENWEEDSMSVQCGNSNQIHAVGQKLPNTWGLYDMIGNGMEICLDVHPDSNGVSETVPYDFYKGAEVTDPVGITNSVELTITTSTRRAVRGGAWFYDWDKKKGAGENRFGCGDRWNINPPASYNYNAIRLVCPAVF